MTSPNEGVRALVTVLLRQIVLDKTDQMLLKVTPAMRKRVQMALLEAITREERDHVRRKLVDTTSELAGLIFQLGPNSSARDWPELITFMFQMASNPKAQLREAAFLMFTRLSHFVCDALGPQQLPTVKMLFARGLQEDDLTVRLAAMGSAFSFIQFNFDDASKKEFQGLLPKMAEAVSLSLSRGSEEDAQKAIGMLVELAESEPLFFRPAIGNFCELMAKVITTQTLEDNTRQYALEFLVTLCEVKPGMMRKVPNFINSLFNICMAMLLEMEDDETWYGRASENVEVTNSEVASESLDRLCLALTGRVVVPIVQNTIPALLKSANWKQRYAGLQTMCIMGEGCNEQVADNLGAFVQMMVPFFNDENPRVRHVAFNTLGQMCTDFGPVLQEEFHAQIMPRLLTQIENEKVEKVQAHCCACLVNWCENLDPLALQPYLVRLMTAVGNCIKLGSVVVQEQALVSLAAVAECLQEQFVPFYGAFMPLCKTVMLRANGPKFRDLQGKAIDAITIMAAAVGAQRFQADAAQILPAMVELQKSNMANDDPRRKHLMQGWARVCRCLKEHFAPYLPVVIPPLLVSANIKPEVVRTDIENQQNLVEEGGWDFRDVGGEQMAIKTSASEEKTLACNMLYCFAHDLEEHFMPYVADTTKILVPLLNYYLDEPTREAVAAAVPVLLKCVVKHIQKRGGSQQLIRDLWLSVFPVILESIDAEPAPNVLISKVHCFRDALNVIGPGCLSPEHERESLIVFMTTTHRCLKAKYHLSVREEEEDFDEIEAGIVDSEQVVNEELLVVLADLHSQLIKANPAAYMELLPQLAVENNVLMQMIMKMAEKPLTSTDLQIAICMMDDIIEFGGSASAALYQQFMPFLMKNMDNPSGDVRQASVYGIGVFFEKAPVQLTEPVLFNNMLKKLHVIITSKNSRQKKSVMATENAISAFAKALEFKPELLQDEKSAVEAFVNYLPVKKDREEAKITYARFVRFVSGNRKFIFGDNFALLPKILSLLVEILGSKCVEAELNPVILSTIEMLRKNLPAAAMQEAFTRLTPELKAKLASGAFGK